MNYIFLVLATSGQVLDSCPSFVTDYSNKLKEKCKLVPVVDTNDWPPKVGKACYGRLALLEEQQSDVKFIDKEQKKIWNTVRGNHDKIVENTRFKKIEINDLLKPTAKKDLCKLVIVVDGPPGTGKTTLCRRLLNLWATDQLPNDQYKLVLYCSLRDKRIVQASNVSDLLNIICCYHKNKSVSEWFEHNNGNGILIIFDGWDELSFDEKKSSSLAKRIIDGEYLLKSAVIVTSRSYASDSLLSLSPYFKHVEVVGFCSEKEVYKVIEDSLESVPDSAKKLIEELKIKTDIRSLCYVPLVCSIVIVVFIESNELPSRLTTLFERFVLETIKRHVDNSNTIKIDPKRVRSLKNLPSDITTQYQELCRFAYLSLKENNPKMTFALPELQDSIDISSTQGHLGLMTTVCVYTQELYQFLHLTIQEFLAAWWLANSDDKYVQVFGEHFENDHFRMCLRFLAGLTGLNDEYFKHNFFNQQIDLRCPRMSGVRDVKCRNLLTTNVPQQLLHLLYESNNVQLCQQLGHNVANRSFCFERCFADSNDSFDGLCLLYFLRNSGIVWNGIHFYVRNGLARVITNDTCKLLVTCKNVSIHFDNDLFRYFREDNMLGLHYDEDKILGRLYDEVRILKGFLEILSSSLEECDCYCSQSPCDVLMMLLKLPQVQIINLSYIDTIPLSNQKMYQLEKNIEKAATVTALSLRNQDIGGESLSKITDCVLRGLIKNQVITSFLMCGFDFCRSGSTLEKLLKFNKKIETLCICHCLQPSDLNIKEINSPLKSLRVSWILGDYNHIRWVVSETRNLSSIYINSLQSCSVSELFENHASLTDIHFHLDYFDCLQRLQTNIVSLEVLKIVLPSHLPVDDCSFLLQGVFKQNILLKHLEITLKGSLKHISRSNLHSNQNLRVLKIKLNFFWMNSFGYDSTFGCDSNDLKDLFDDISKIKNLSTLKFEIPFHDNEVIGHKHFFDQHSAILFKQIIPFVTSTLSQSNYEHFRELVVNIWIGSTSAIRGCYFGPKIEPIFSQDDIYLFNELFEAVFAHPTIEYVKIFLPKLFYKSLIELYTAYRQKSEQPPVMIELYHDIQYDSSLHRL